MRKHVDMTVGHGLLDTSHGRRHITLSSPHPGHALVAGLTSQVLLVAIALALAAGTLLLVRPRLRRGALPTEIGLSLLSPKPSDEPCSQPGCREQTEWTCGYREKTGQRCDSTWCSKHITVVRGATYCRRHAAIAKTLDQTEGSIFEVKSQPSLEDRAVPLLELLRQDLGPDLTKLLADVAAGNPTVVVAGQKSIQEVQIEGERIAWQVSWGLHTTRGYLLRLAIRVGVPEPPVVQAIVANEMVFQSVPYWITRRLTGEAPLASDHNAFHADFMRAVQEAVRDKLPDVMSQLEFESERFGSTAVRRY